MAPNLNDGYGLTEGSSELASSEAGSEDVDPIALDLSRESLEVIAGQYPVYISRAMRTLLWQPKADQGDTGLQKAAALAVGLGPDLAARVMEHLTEAEIKQIAGEISKTSSITSLQRDTAFEETKNLLLAEEDLYAGGIDLSQRIVEKAYSSDRAREIVNTLLPFKGLSFLENMDFQQVTLCLAPEHPQTIALILSQVQPEWGAKVLIGLPENTGSDVACRLALLERTSTRALRTIESRLKQELKYTGSNRSIAVGGITVAAEIVELMAPDKERDLLQQLDSVDSGLAESIRHEIFSFDDISKLGRGTLRTLVQSIDGQKLAMALKGSSEAVRNQFLSVLSTGRARMVREEMEFLGPIRLSDAEDMQRQIVQIALALEANGQINLAREGQSLVFENEPLDSVEEAEQVTESEETEEYRDVEEAEDLSEILEDLDLEDPISGQTPPNSIAGKWSRGIRKRLSILFSSVAKVLKRGTL